MPPAQAQGSPVPIPSGPSGMIKDQAAQIITPGQQHYPIIPGARPSIPGAAPNTVMRPSCVNPACRFLTEAQCAQLTFCKVP